MAQLLWDRTTRLTHWVIAIAVIFNLWVLEEGDDAHQIAGYCAVAAVALRGIWGFWGGSQSRFSSFPLSFKDSRDFFSSYSAGGARQFPGHNPIASIVYLGIWIGVLGLGLTGWMMTLDTFWGDERLEDIHSSIANAMQALVILHLMGMALDSIRFKRRTWMSMFTGRRS